MFFNFFNNDSDMNKILKYLLQDPTAVAKIKGGQSFPNIGGEVKFYQTPYGVVVLSEIKNLPKTQTNIFGFHIHEFGNCENDFSSAGGHFNPQMSHHPNHAGDLPPLFSNEGYVLSAVLTSRFNVKSILGKSVIIHDNPDDFTTDPSGNSGKRIACGKIVEY